MQETLEQEINFWKLNFSVSLVPMCVLYITRVELTFYVQTVCNATLIFTLIYLTLARFEPLTSEFKVGKIYIEVQGFKDMPFFMTVGHNDV